MEAEKCGICLRVHFIIHWRSTLILRREGFSASSFMSRSWFSYSSRLVLHSGCYLIADLEMARRSYQYSSIKSAYGKPYTLHDTAPMTLILRPCDESKDNRGFASETHGKAIDAWNAERRNGLNRC